MYVRLTPTNTYAMTLQRIYWFRIFNWMRMCRHLRGIRSRYQRQHSYLEVLVFKNTAAALSLPSPPLIQSYSRIGTQRNNRGTETRRWNIKTTAPAFSHHGAAPQGWLEDLPIGSAVIEVRRLQWLVGYIFIQRGITWVQLRWLHLLYMCFLVLGEGSEDSRDYLAEIYQRHPMINVITPELMFSVYSRITNWVHFEEYIQQ